MGNPGSFTFMWSLIFTTSVWSLIIPTFVLNLVFINEDVLKGVIVELV
jgi:hypothetical protein